MQDYTYHVSHVHIRRHSIRTGTEKNVSYFRLVVSLEQLTVKPLRGFFSCLFLVSRASLLSMSSTKETPFICWIILDISFLQTFVQLGCSNAHWQGHDEYFRVSAPSTNTGLVLPRARCWFKQVVLVDSRIWPDPAANLMSFHFLKERFCIMWWPWRQPFK